MRACGSGLREAFNMRVCTESEYCLQKRGTDELNAI